MVATEDGFDAGARGRGLKTGAGRGGLRRVCKRGDMRQCVIRRYIDRDERFGGGETRVFRHV